MSDERNEQTPERDPHHALNNPVGEPDPTEWPDPFDRREDPLDPIGPDGQPFGEQPHVPPGSRSTSQPHSKDDIEAPYVEGPKRDKLDR
jgi:hypothetical protein